MRVFSEWQNIEVLMEGDADAFLERRKEEGNFGEPKLVGLFAGLQILRSHSHTLKYCVFGHNHGWLSDIVEEICQILKFTAVSKVVGNGDVTDCQDSEGYNLIVDSGCTEVGRYSLLSNFVANSQPKSVVFLSNLAAIIRDDAQISRREQISSIEKYGFDILLASYFGVFLKGCAPVNTRHIERLSPVEQERCLFVVGHARSGSSAISQLLNISDDINILFEANFHIRKNTHSLVENFNSLNNKYNRPLEKGFFLASFYNSAENVAGLYSLMLGRYRLVGDKMAYGARENFYVRHPVEDLIDFVMDQFPYSKYIITMREPRSAVVAMSRMVPYLTVDLLIDFWLGGIIKMIDLLLISERAMMLFHEDSASQKKHPIHLLVGEDLRDAWGIYREENITTSQAIVDNYLNTPEWINHSDLLRLLSEKYEDLRASLSSNTGRIKSPSARQAVLDVRLILNKVYLSFLSDLQT